MGRHLGHEVAQAEWEKQYAAAQQRFDAHKVQVVAAKKADAEAGTDAPTSFSSEEPDPGEGALASDEALAALREKLTGA